MALVATLARTPEQARPWRSVVALILGLLGGSFFPVAQAGGVLAALSLASPTRGSCAACGDLPAARSAAPRSDRSRRMLAFAVVTGGLAAMRIHRLVTL